MENRHGVRILSAIHASNSPPVPSDPPARGVYKPRRPLSSPLFRLDRALLGSAISAFFLSPPEEKLTTEIDAKRNREQR
jgi:hypothetical protein